ncbi:hypothetical protein LshimejAT787_2000790 [Lyophyllum shimeji]|uniref:Uncharacterized protein n=1 Tax=Lyophyllum shimeji TaxID=47721 RepID=A0A9P3URK1_LYOSH|nr:hypothetical protein LshimejAT787_2000790 [Lyophyllum shimeji]
MPPSLGINRARTHPGVIIYLPLNPSQSHLNDRNHLQVMSTSTTNANATAGGSNGANSGSSSSGGSSSGGSSNGGSTSSSTAATTPTQSIPSTASSAFSGFSLLPDYPSPPLRVGSYQDSTGYPKVDGSVKLLGRILN